MKYYRYGSESVQCGREVEVKEKRKSNESGGFGGLVIDDDTIYEIDEECLRCQKENK